MAIYRAKEPFAYTDPAGVPRTVRAGDLFNGDDACVVQRPRLFEAVEVAASRTTAVESATAAPGEKRSVSTRGRGKRAASKRDDGEQKATTNTTDGGVDLGDDADGSDLS